MGIDSLEHVLYNSLKDLLSAEKQFRDALPKLAQAAVDSELSEAFQSHHAETLEHITRLQQCFELLGRPERSEKCDAAAGLTKEAAGMIEEDGTQPAKDVALIGAGRKTEHYEIASYLEAVAVAKSLKQPKIVELLQATLKEEHNADSHLERIGKRLRAAAN